MYKIYNCGFSVQTEQPIKTVKEAKDFIKKAVADSKSVEDFEPQKPKDFKYKKE